MSASNRFRKSVGAGLSAAALVLAAYSGISSGQSIKVTLSGGDEVPAVKTSASGSGTITVAADKSVSGSLTTTGMSGVAAHIHQGAKGQNGPVAVGMVKSGDNGWSLPAGAKLNDAQYEAFKAGNLYVNVHTAENKGGEIRGQLKP